MYNTVNQRKVVVISLALATRYFLNEENNKTNTGFIFVQLYSCSLAVVFSGSAFFTCSLQFPPQPPQKKKKKKCENISPNPGEIFTYIEPAGWQSATADVLLFYFFFPLKVQNL